MGLDMMSSADAAESVVTCSGDRTRRGGLWPERFSPRSPSVSSYDLYDVDLIAADCVADAVPTGDLRRVRLCDAARDAVIYGLPAAIQYWDLYRNVLAPGASRSFETWQHNRELARPGFADFVSPNVDTLYSTAWLDLTDGPVEIVVPEMGDRYYTVNLLDAFANAVNLSTRTLGPSGGRVWVVPPGWSGEVPEGARTLRVSTPYQWILLRIFVRSALDAPAAHELQDEFVLRRPGASCAGSTAVAAAEWPAAPTGDNWDGADVLAALDAVLRHNGYPVQEEALLARFQVLGIGSDSALNPNDWSSELREFVEEGFQSAMALIHSAAGLRGRPAGDSGWRTLSSGAHGYNYLSRAASNLIGPGGTTRDESGPYTTHVDEGGAPLDGSHSSYRLQFRPPPVDAFWSLTVYGLESRRLVPNPVDRYAINSAAEGLPWAPDGSLDIFVGWEPDPAGGVWLPAPTAEFYLVVRAYLGHPEVVDGSWAPCRVQRVPRSS